MYKHNNLLKNIRQNSVQAESPTVSTLNGSSITFSKRSHKGRSKSTLNNSMMLPNNKFIFGLPEYKPPKINFFKPAVKLAKFHPSKRIDFIDDYTKAKGFLPSPDKYETQEAWIKKQKDMQFSKLPRITFSEVAIKQSPRTPGPGAYNPEPPKRKLGTTKMTSRRELGFINEAKYKGENNPLSFDAKFKLVSPRVKSPNFKKLAKPRETRIVKQKEGTSRKFLNFKSIVTIFDI